MNIYSIATPFNIELKFQIGSFGKRLLAWLIDFVAIYAYNFVFVIFIFGNIRSLNIEALSTWDSTQILLLILLMIPSVFYHLISQLLWSGRSLGKFVAGLKVVNGENGGAASTSQIVIRNILCFPNFLLAVTFVTAIMPLYLVGVLMILGLAALPDMIFIFTNAQNKKIGDLVAGTMVIQTNYRPDISRTIFQDFGDNIQYILKYQNVAVLSDREINGLNKIVKAAQHYSPEYLNKISQKLEQKLGVYSHEADPIDFFSVVIQDYNYYHQQIKSA